MAEKGTQVEPLATGSPTATPEPQAQPNLEPAVVELQRKMEALEKQNADKDRYITDLKTTQETLEARLQSRDTQAPPLPDNLQETTKQILEKAQFDPEGASKDLAVLIKNSNDRTKQELMQGIQPMIEESMYITEMKSQNKDLVDFFGEDVLYLKGAALIQQGRAKSGREAVDIMVKEYRVKYDSLKSNVPSIPPPAQAMGEGGANKPPEPTPPLKEVTQEDEIRARQEKRAKVGL